MGKVNFKSPEKSLMAPLARVYDFISDLNNFETLMPEQVINWKSSPEECSFDIKGMAHINLGISEKIPEKLVKISSREGTPIDFVLSCQIEGLENGDTRAFIELDAQLSTMLKLMASGPLQNLVNIMAGKLEDEFNS
jgi:carbon monoxide dehydrogenase subunit G